MNDLGLLMLNVDSQRIHEDVVRGGLELPYSESESLKRCPIDIDLIDANRVDGGDGISDRMLTNALGENLSHLRRQQLGIAETPNPIIRF